MNFNLGARLTLAIGVVILATSALVFTGIYRMQEEQALAQINSQAQALLSQMVVTRQWVADYGGVWTKRSGEYWWSSKDGYFQKTPAMVTKELSQRAAVLGFYQYHITSLKLINEENAPSDFEREALHGFENRPMAISNIEIINNVKMYRYMIPLNTSEACLQCHADQGYRVGDVRGGLSVLVPMKSVDESLGQSRAVLIIAAIVLVSLVMFLLYTLVQRVAVRPILQLQNVAVAVRKGNYDVSCSIHTGDELETLGNAVNQMVAGLKQSHEELNQKIARRNREFAGLSSIALTISQMEGLDDVLLKVLDETVGLLNVDGGTIQLWDDTRKTGTLSATNGLNLKLVSTMESMVFDPGTSAEPLFVSDTQNNPRGYPFYVSGYQAFARIPLKSKKRALGVLHLFSRRPLTFSSEDTSLLIFIGNQIGVAVENAWYAKRIEQTAIVEERNRLAREIHDSIAQALGYLNLKTDLLEGMITRNEWNDARREIIDVRRIVRDSCYDVRESIDGLRTRLSDSTGLIPTIASYLHEFGQRSGLVTEYTMAEADVRFPPVVETEILRIIQEALTNVRKHAQAKRVRVAIEKTGNAASIQIEDDGRGFNPEALSDSQHFGLRIMRERAESLGGIFQVESTLGQGTRITVKVVNGSSQPRT
jgi:two-component system nitrate/nitrite sensor histidine kinase NarX